MHRNTGFLSLRLSLFAALGLAACGPDIETATSNGGQGGAGAGSQTSTGTQSSSGTGGASSAGCAGGVPIIVVPDGPESGYIKCADGTIHREEARDCDPTITAQACVGDEPFKSCMTDADCIDKPHGKCIHSGPAFENPEASCGCAYSCTNDAECGEDAVCVCPGIVETGVTWPKCVSTLACKTDADCASGECGITSYNDGCFQQVGLQCRAAGDVCRVDADCAGVPGSPFCVVSPFSVPAGQFSCQGSSCAIGRPLLVAGAPRTAPSTGREDWASEEHRPALEGLEPEVREALAATWMEIAALEHASVASFARFSLQLLSIGAPADLLLLSQQAAADEVEHARIAYGLASHYAGERVGPAPLDLSGVRVETDARAILASLIEEACVGETIGAAEALSLSQAVADPVLRAVHARIARDEQRHAELAWRTLGFMLGSASPELVAFARGVFARAMEGASGDVTLPRSVVAPEQGLLSASEIASLRRQVMRDVVKPCAEAMFARLQCEERIETTLSA